MLKGWINQEQVGYFIKYTAAFIVHKFVQGSRIEYTSKYVYKTVNIIASKTKIPTPSPRILFERAVDAVQDAY